MPVENSLILTPLLFSTFSLIANFSYLYPNKTKQNIRNVCRQTFETQIFSENDA
jgi:hypothetical protein